MHVGKFDVKCSGMNERTSGLNHATSEQQSNQSKAQAKFGKRHIASIVAGILLSLTGIGLFIGIPLIYIGTRKLSSRTTTVLTKDTIQCGTKSNRNKEANQNTNSSNTSPQPTSLTTNDVPTVTIQPGEYYGNVANDVVDFVKKNSENITKCMANDGTFNYELNNNGILINDTTNSNLMKSINTAKQLSDDELKGLINGTVKISEKIKDIQAWKDLERNCHTINIYGTTLTYKDKQVKNEQNESYEYFIKRVADAIKHHETQKLNKQEEEKLTNDEEKQIEEKQIKFFRQIFKYPGQALSGGSLLTYNAFFTSYCQQSILTTHQTTDLNYTISLTENDKITIESTYQAIIIDTAELNGVEQNMANFPNRLCIEEKIIATISLSEGEKGDESKFTVNKNTTTFFIANTYGKQRDLHIDKRIKSVIEMEYTNENGKTPTFTINEPVEGSEETKIVKTLQLLNNTCEKAEKLEE